MPFKPPLLPKWPGKLLEWFCPDELLEEVQGDLQERYYLRVQRIGEKKARRLYFSEVMAYMRPSVLKKRTNTQLNYFINILMLQHSLLLTYRNFNRHKGSFFINIFCLSIGLACAFLIFLWVRDELSIDSFHAKNSRLFQLINNTKFAGSSTIETSEWTPFPLAEAIVHEMPEVESAVSIFPYEGGKKGIVAAADKQIKAGEQFATKDFFTIFSYPLLEGEKSSVLTDKNSVVISDELAYKLFGSSQNVIGRSVEWDKDGYSGSYLVSGVFQKPSQSSSAQFDIVFSFALFREKIPSVDKWDEYGCINYIVLKKGTHLGKFKEKIAGFLQEKSNANYEQTLLIRLFSDRYLFNKYENGQQAGGRIEYVRLFSIIALFIIIVACINFMNLSTAKASLRLKEVGVKKAIGAGRKTLIVQFLSESVLLSFVSLVVAIILVAIFLPYFNEITGKHLNLKPDTQLILTLLGITLLTGLVAGSYPALYLSSFRPALVLKSKLKTSGGELWVRRGLVIFQFTLSVILIVSVIVVYKQIEFIQSKNLGYNQNIVSFRL